MKLEELYINNASQARVIIKKRKNILNFKIKATNYMEIYLDTEKFIFGNYTIKLDDLLNIHISRKHNRYFDNYMFCIVPKNVLGTRQTDISYCSEEDIDKLKEIFDNFMYSNEVLGDKLMSNEYIPMNEFYVNESNENKNDIKQYYNYKGCFNEEKKTIYENNLEYQLISILPKEYLKGYNKDKFLCFESRWLNANYIEIYIETNYWKKKNKNILVSLKILNVSVICLCVLGAIMCIKLMISNIMKIL